MENWAVIILAAGKGTRMKSDKAKVLHSVAGKSMVARVVECAAALTGIDIHVVVGHQAEQVKAELRSCHQVRFALQKMLLGTGDAVKSALPDLDPEVRDVLVLCGDVPLVRQASLRTLAAAHREMGAKLTVLGVDLAQPRGYGRIVLDADGSLAAIREEADASVEEKKITLVNSGIYCFDRVFLDSTINEIRNANNQAEYYLTDLVEIAVAKGMKTHVVAVDDPFQVMGVNTPEDLARAEALIQERQNELP